VGVLTDIVIADRTDAERVGRSECPYAEFDGIDAKGIDTVKLGTLNAILTNSPFDPSFAASECLFQGSEEGPLVFEVPATFIQRLASLSSEELVHAGTRWAATEEFSPRYDNWPAEDVHELLGRLVALARRAVGAQKSVLIWMSL
jgi:hypothetical protein